VQTGIGDNYGYRRVLYGHAFFIIYYFICFLNAPCIDFQPANSISLEHITSLMLGIPGLYILYSSCATR